MIQSRSRDLSYFLPHLMLPGAYDVGQVRAGEMTMTRVEIVR